MESLGLDERLVRQLCRQMQVVTQVCEGLALRLLELESRLDAVDSSVKGVSLAMESEGLAELLDAVGGRLGDLKELLALEETGVVATSGVPELSLVSGEQDLAAEASSREADGQEHEADSALETVYVDDPDYDSMTA